MYNDIKNASLQNKRVNLMYLFIYFGQFDHLCINAYLPNFQAEDYLPPFYFSLATAFQLQNMYTHYTVMLRQQISPEKKNIHPTANFVNDHINAANAYHIYATFA